MITSYESEIAAVGMLQLGVVSLGDSCGGDTGNLIRPAKAKGVVSLLHSWLELLIFW